MIHRKDSFPSRPPAGPFGSGDPLWALAAIDPRFEPRDPLFEPAEPTLVPRVRRRRKPRPQAPAPGAPPPRETPRVPGAGALALACAGVLAGACGGAPPAGPHLESAVLVQLEPGAAPVTLAAVDDGPPIVALESVGPDDAPPLLRVPVPPGMTADEAARRAAAAPGTAFAEPIFLYESQRTSDDARLRDQWGLAAIHAPAAWDRTVGDRRVTVAVIDDGVALGHPDLAANLWTNPAPDRGDVHGWSFVDGTADPSPDRDTQVWHGTHVAGIVGAVGDNGMGVAGVSWQVSLMALRAVGRECGRADHLAQAIDYAVDHGARVINASWAGPARSRAIAQAIDRAAAHGVLFVAAAGNTRGGPPLFPAAHEALNVLSVGALGPDGALAPFSAQGALVGAPGVGVLSTTAPGLYERHDGTSQAAPHVAGLAALLWAARPDASLAEVRAAILDSAVATDGVRHGAIDAAAALARLEARAAGSRRALARAGRRGPLARPRASLAVAGAGCSLVEGQVHAPAGGACVLSRGASTVWRLPGGATWTSPRLIARFTRPGTFLLQLGEAERVAVVVEPAGSAPARLESARARTHAW